MTATVTFGPWYQRLIQPRGVVQDLASKVREDADPFVPYRDGNLASGVAFLTQGLTVQIVYTSVYAHYVFKGVAMAGHAPKHYTGKSLNYFTGKHSQAGADWIERAKSANMPGWESLVKGMLLDG
jgi:hypothetical protein